MSSIKDPENPQKTTSGFSRRGFMRGVGLSGGAIGAGLLEEEAQAAPPAASVSGPAAVPITLQINGKAVKISVEPRETLLDTMRNSLDLTAAKRVCDRGTCGACTIIVSGKVMYSCSMLAIDAQGKEIETLEGISAKNHPIIAAFVANDAQQCGYCTPGFVVASKGFLDRHPSPTYEEVKMGLGGNLCRCGTYMGIRQAVVDAGKQLKGGRNA